MTTESERKQVLADEASATVRNDARIAALERELVIDTAAAREAATKPVGEPPSWWTRIKRWLTGF